MLGGFSVSVGARSIEEGEWRLKKAASLVKLLALEPGHWIHRERVMDLLWPELDLKAQASNLRHVLYVVRRVLGPSPNSGSRYLARRGEGLTLCPEMSLWVDAEAFEEAAAAARRTREPAAYEAAIGLYAGELLPEDRYEGWAEDRREALRRLHHALLVELAGLYEEREEPAAATEALGQVVAEEPAHEVAHAGLMRLYARAGRREEALGQYERLREALARDLDEPATASRRLYEEISAGRFPLASPDHITSRPEGPPDAPQHNLSEEISSFVGRGRERMEVKRELATTRLLTLMGAGGAGKTRLARAVARDLAGTYPDGAWLVELAPLSQGTLLPQAVASALGVREQPGRPLDATITDHLRSRRLLLVLDNCEHVVDAASRLADGLLSACPGLHVLATSREALRISGEAVWRVPSLSLPGSDGGAVTAEELGRSEAVRLFVERARSRRQGFELTNENAGPVAEVCRRLEGMPLAIELAAARAGVLSPGQVVERLDDSLSLLRGGGRTTEVRHQTLRGALDWSYDLLDEPERKLLKRLSVFAGGWTLEAAEAVGSTAGEDVLDLLESLADKSLVVTEGARYRLLEPIRQYAREKLQENEEDAREAHRRHADWYLDLAEEAEEELTGPDYQAWLERLETEHDNLRTALSWSLDGEEAGLGLELAAALWLFWYTRGHLAEGRGWLEKALAATA